IADAPDARPLARLLQEVDDALGRIERGTFGICDVCEGTVEAGRIASDPLLRTCLSCLTAAEQRALERDLDLAVHVQRALLPPQGVPVGLFANAPFPTTRLTLGIGDSLLLYTDGVTELIDVDGCEFGRDRLVASASRGERASVSDVVAACVAELERFRGDNQ